jgi:2-phosphoglycerate kinase
MNIEHTQANLRAILIGGPSNAGKSTLAESLALRLGWRHRSTDRLARYPGRPWRKDRQAIPEHLIEHYSSLSVGDLFAGVRDHYRNMWPEIKALVTSHATDCSTERLILEGSAIWPETVVTLDLENVVPIWLAPSDELLEDRIHKASHFEETSVREQEIIQKFVGRAWRYNEEMKAAATQFDIETISIEAPYCVEQLTDKCLELIEHHSRRIITGG